jgi:hypothetical protein
MPEWIWNPQFGQYIIWYGPYWYKQDGTTFSGSPPPRDVPGWTWNPLVGQYSAWSEQQELWVKQDGTALPGPPPAQYVTEASGMHSVVPLQSDHESQDRDDEDRDDAQEGQEGLRHIKFGALVVRKLDYEFRLWHRDFFRPGKVSSHSSHINLSHLVSPSPALLEPNIPFYS